MSLDAIAGTAREPFYGIRKFCLGLGPNVVEHIRQHRVVFGKSMAMRWFADVSVDDGTVVVKLNEGRRVEPSIIRIDGDITTAYDAIKAAYERV